MNCESPLSGASHFNRVEDQSTLLSIIESTFNLLPPFSSPNREEGTLARLTIRLRRPWDFYRAYAHIQSL